MKLGIGYEVMYKKELDPDAEKRIFKDTGEKHLKQWNELLLMR